MILNEQSGDDRKAYVEFFLDKAKIPKHRFRVKYENGKVAAASNKGHGDKADMVNAFRMLILSRWDYRKEDRGDKFWIVNLDTGQALEVEFYRTKSKGWRWRCSTSEENIIGRSTEGYVKKSDLIDNFHYVVMTPWKIESEE